MKVKCLSVWTAADSSRHVRLFFGSDGGVIDGQAELVFIAGHPCPFEQGKVYDASFAEHVAPSLTISEAKTDLEAEVGIALGSHSTRQVTARIKDLAGEREATGTMSATRNALGGIDYTVDIDPLDLTAQPSGV